MAAQVLRGKLLLRPIEKLIFTFIVIIICRYLALRENTVTI